MREEGYITQKNLLKTKGVDIIERYTVGCDNVPPINVPSEAVRLHDLVIKCKVEEPNWNKDREFITHLNIKGFREWQTVGGKHQWFPYDLETSVRLTSKSVLIKMPDVYGSTPLMAKENALKIFYQVRERLEALLKTKLKHRADFNFCVVSSQHVAFIYDELAKYFLKEGLTLRIYDQKKKLIWVVDDSLGLAELEAVHKAKAEEVGDIYKDFLQDLSKGDHENLSALTRELAATKKQLHRLQYTLNQQAQTQAEISSEIIQTLTSHSVFTNTEVAGQWN